jgi:hypothetical protein
VHELVGNNYTIDVELWLLDQFATELEVPKMSVDIDPGKVKYVILDPTEFEVK